jgi:2-polyprenyl-3-methyl-5-hydroxy-6-metoxy-1,4-benzoquinol methylase
VTSESKSRAAHIDGMVPGTIYAYCDSEPSHTRSYLWPVLRSVIEAQSFSDRRAFDLGCGNGATAEFLTGLGFGVTGVDPSETGIEVARKRPAPSRFYLRSSRDELAKEFGTFPLVVSFEVVSFVLDPPLFAKRIYELLEPGGIAVVSAPYHGYLKNLAFSLLNGWDRHLDPFWSGTLLRFFSMATYRRLWAQAGFQDIIIRRVGRVPPIAKAMVAVLRK